MSTRFIDLSWRMKVFFIALPLVLFAVLWNIASWRPQLVGTPVTEIQFSPTRRLTNGRPTAIAFSPDNKMLAISREHTVWGRRWIYASNQIDIHTGFRWRKLFRMIHAPKKAVTQNDNSISASPFHRLQFSPDGKYIAGLGISHDFAVVRVASGATTFILKDNDLPKASQYHRRDYLFVGFSRDSNRVLVLECWLRKYNVRNAEGKPLHKAVLLQINTASGHVVSRVSVQLKAGQWPERTVLLNDNTFVCTTERDEGSNSTTDGTASLFNVQTGKNQHVLAVGHNETFSLAVSPNTQKFAVSYLRRFAKSSTVIYDLSGKRKVVLDDNNRGIENLAFSPDGKQIAGTQDGAIWLWNTSTGKGIRRVGTNRFVSDLAFSSDGKTLASVDLKSAKIWRVE